MANPEYPKQYCLMSNASMVYSQLHPTRTNTETTGEQPESNSCVLPLGADVLTENHDSILYPGLKFLHGIKEVPSKL